MPFNRQTELITPFDEDMKREAEKEAGKIASYLSYPLSIAPAIKLSNGFNYPQNFLRSLRESVRDRNCQSSAHTSSIPARMTLSHSWPHVIYVFLFVELTNDLLELILELRAWSSVRPRVEKEQAIETLEREAILVQEIEQEQGALSITWYPGPWSNHDIATERVRERLCDFVASIQAALSTLVAG
jgi:hypothetical protein